MTRIVLIIIAIFTFQLLKSQDTLMLFNGQKKAVKILEINPISIKYTRINTETPIYVQNKNEVYWMKYKDGSTDTINKNDPTIVSKKLQLINYRICDNKGPVSDAILMVMINNYPKVNTKNQLGIRNNELSKLSKIKLTCFLAGLGTGYLTLLFGSNVIQNVLITNISQNNAVIPFLILSAGFGSSIYFFAKTTKKIQRKKLELVNLYNNDL